VTATDDFQGDRQSELVNRDIEKKDPMSSKLHITEVGRVAIPAADQDRSLEF
jgi:hypothetical protein